MNQFEKLKFFVQLAVMDQQFPLVVIKNEGQLEQLKTAIEGQVMPVIEANNIQTLKNTAEGMVLFNLTTENHEEICEILANYEGGTFPITLKMMFVIDKEFLESLSDHQHTSIITLFSPVFRFET